MLKLWSKAPTPDRTKYLRKTDIDRLLKQHRIRRVDAETVLATLRQFAIKVADGVAAAACGHIRSLIVRLQPINNELRAAERKLNELCAELAGSGQAPGESGQLPRSAGGCDGALSCRQLLGAGVPDCHSTLPTRRQIRSPDATGAQAG